MNGKCGIFAQITYSILIWGILLNFIKLGSNKEELIRGVYWWFRRENRYAYFPSHILLRLRNEQWIYSKYDICCRPGEITLSNLSPDYEIATDEARFLLDYLHFKTEAEDEYFSRIPEDKRKELLEAAELIRLRANPVNIELG